MRTVARSICVAVLALMVWVPTSPAVAKGPTDVAVEGPGVDRQVTYTRRAGDVDIGTLMEAARVHELWNGKNLAPEAPMTPDELGPRYVLTWTVAGMDWAVEHAYPFAEGGAWVKFFPNAAKAGWTRAPGLTKQLVALGAVPDSPKRVLAQSPSVSATEAPAPAAGDEDDAPSYRVLVPAGALLASVLVAGVLIVRRRRLSR